MVRATKPPTKRKTVKRQKRTPWLRSVGEAFVELLEAEGYERKDVPTDAPQVTNFLKGDGIHLALLQEWCAAVDVDLDELFLAAILKRLPSSFPVRSDVQSEAQHLKELAHMLRDPEKQRVLSYLNDMNRDEAIELVVTAHDIWKRRHSTARRAVHGP